jgi:hypothetical protein
MSDLIALSALCIDTSLQMREAIDEDTIAEYAEAIRDGTTFPPVTAFQDPERILWLADGFHRVQAHLKAEQKEIVADIRSGSRDDALLFAVGCNAEHGRRRTNADKRVAVRALLVHPVWGTRSDHWIAEQARVSHHLVATIKQSLAVDADNGFSHGNSPKTEPKRDSPRKYRTKDGSVRIRRVKRKSGGNPSPPKTGAIDACEEAPTEEGLRAGIGESEFARLLQDRDNVIRLQAEEIAELKKRNEFLGSDKAHEACDEKARKLKKDLEEKDGRIAKLEADLATSFDKNAESEELLAGKDKRIAKLETKIAALEGEAQ